MLQLPIQFHSQGHSIYKQINPQMDPSVSPEEHERAFRICRDHLNGAWKVINLNDLTVTRQCGGMSNLLYRCAITNPKLINLVAPNEGHQVLLRLYGPAHKDTEAQLEIFKKLAQENLGPKLYAILDGGRLEEYLPSTSLTNEQMLQTDISAVIATKLALVHKLQFDCLDKRPNWLLDMYKQQYQFILSIRNERDKLLRDGGDPLSVIPFQADAKASTKLLANQLLDIDLGLEIDFMTRLLNQSQGPVVFSHNDLHQNNIILLQNVEMLGQKKTKSGSFHDRIVLIDFEYSSYNYRTFDLGNHLSEWCFDYNEDKYPYFKLLKEKYPTDERQRQFLRHYLGLESKGVSQSLVQNTIKQQTNHRAKAINGNGRQHDKDNGLDSASKAAISSTTKTDECPLRHEENQNDENNLVEQLFNEMQPFLMASNLLWAMWAIQSACTSKINFGYWEMARAKYDVYLLSKEKFVNKYGAQPTGKDSNLKVRAPKM